MERPVKIEIKNLQFTYPRSSFRLQIDQLDIRRGKKVAVVGPSGSGKTTLLNLISGIEVANFGEINVDERQVSKLGDKDRRDFRINHIGAVFQQFELVEYLNVRDNIILPYLINNSLSLGQDVHARVAQLAEQVGIADKMNRRVTRLSRGEQQRVAICRALVPRPTLILADEPTGNLDPSNKHKILELLFEQCNLGDLTLIAVTHDLNILDGFDETIDFDDFRDEVGS